MGDFEHAEQPALPGIVRCNHWGGISSPMEELFLRALIDSGVFHEAPATSDLLVATGPLGVVLRQLPVTAGKDRYRIDFAIVAHDGPPWLACEIDGFAFHSSK